MFRAGYAVSDLFYRGMVFLLSAIALYAQGTGFYAEFVRDIAVFNLIYNISLLSVPTFLVRQAVQSGTWPSVSVLAYLSILVICLPVFFSIIIFAGVKFEIVLAVFGALVLEIFFARVRALDGNHLLTSMIFLVSAVFFLSVLLLFGGVQEFRFWALFVIGLTVVGLVSIDLRRRKRVFGSLDYFRSGIWPMIRDLLMFGVPISIHQLIFWFRSGFDKIFLFSKIDAGTFAVYGAIFQILSVMGVLLGVFLRTYQAPLYSAMENFSTRRHIRVILLLLLTFGIFIIFSLLVSDYLINIYFSDLISALVVKLLILGGCLHFVNQIFAFAYSFFGRTLAFLALNSIGLLVYLSVVVLGGASLFAFSAAYFFSTLVISIASSAYLILIFNRH